MNTLAEAATEKDVYLPEFNRLEKELARRGRPGVQRLRRAAIARFDELGFPTPRNEDWKFTSLAALTKVPFRPAESVSDSLKATQLAHILGMDAACRLVFIDGYFAPELSAMSSLPAGVIVGSLATALDESSETVEAHLGRHARFEEHAFTALNTAFFRDGAFLFAPKGKVVEAPIHLVFVVTAPAEPTVSYPRNLIVAGDNSRLTVVESYAGLADDVTFTNAVTEFVLGDGAAVDHCKVQQESVSAFHIATTQVHLGRAANFASCYVGLGGGLVRNEARALFTGEGAECTLDGLYQLDGRQHMDNHTVIDHAVPRCASHELYKGVLDGKSRGVFNGKIFVREDAQKTDAKQTNKTLLLSDDAVINTKPQLEIFADDVKCTHGATVGQLDDEAIFYLRARGIGLEDARGLLTYAFANDVVGRVRVESVRRRLEQALLTARRLPALSNEE
jgi:Fe-S cluster assembly protein SufD